MAQKQGEGRATPRREVVRLACALINHILPLFDGLNDRLKAGIDVLDVGCGSGLALVAMAESFPDSQFVGFDLCEETIARTRTEVAARGLSNVRFEQRDVTRLADNREHPLGPLLYTIS